MRKTTSLFVSASLAGLPVAAPVGPAAAQGYGGEITCESQNYQYRRCSVPTRGHVELIQQLGGNRCVEGRSWGFDRNSIWVDNGCRARFAYGGSYNPGYPGGGGGYYPPPSGGNGWGGNYAGTINCDSRNYQYNRCNVYTNGRVDLLDTRGGTCRQGYSWGYDRNSIWVNNGCRAQFGYGYGNNDPDKNKGNGGAIAGVALAAGLVALIAAASSSNKKSGEAAAAPQINPEAPPARIDFGYSGIPSAQRPSVETCLNEAARQVGITGATSLGIAGQPQIQKISSGYSIRATVIATYPDQTRRAPIECRADGEQLLSLDFVS